MNLAKWYVIIVGGLFLFAVGFTLAKELFTAGISVEAGHKAVHVAFGVWAAVIVLRKQTDQYRTFALTNGILWGAVALIGWTIPDFLELMAFNRVDTILHTVVAVTGLVAGWKKVQA